MKKLLLLILLIMVGMVHAYPDLQGQRVTDGANLLLPNEIYQLTQHIYAMENSTGAQFAIVTVKNTEGDARVDYASRIGDQNGVGQKGLDNGVVILWSLENEKGGAIATGRGVGDILNDAKVSRIGRAHRPEFDNKEYYKAFDGILTDITAEFHNNSTGISANNTIDTSQIPVWVWILIGVIVLFILIGAAASSDDSGGSGGSGGFSSTYIGGSGGWSHSSGGGGSFGGGGFGGGGGAF